MSNITKPYTFQNQTTADANQVNQDFDTLYTAVNGNIDGTNVKDGSLGTSDFAPGAVTPAKTEGLTFAHHLFGSGFIFSGLTVTKDGTNLNQVDVTAGVVYITQADGTRKEYEPVATNFRTSSPSNTYYLDFQPDGTWWWNTGHSQQANYINVATVTSDASSNVNVVTQNNNSYAVSILGNAQGPVMVGKSTMSIIGNYIPIWVDSSTSVTSTATAAGSTFLVKASATTSASASTVYTLNANVSPAATFALESSIKSSSASVTANAQLWDVTIGALVGNALISTTSTSFAPVRSTTPFSLTPGHNYGLTIWMSTTGTAYLTDVYLVNLT